MSFSPRVESENNQSNETAGVASPRWYQDWGNIVVAGMTMYVAAYLIWLLVGSSETQWTILFSNLAFLPVMIFGSIFALRIARSPVVDRQTRRAWALITVGFLFWLLGDIAWAYLEFSGRLSPFPSVADLLYLAKFPFFVAGILSFPASPFSRREHITFWLDAFIILIGVGTVIWPLLAPPFQAATNEISPELLLALAHPVLHFLTVFAVFNVLVRRPASGSLRMLLMLSIGLLGLALAEQWWLYDELQGNSIDRIGNYALWMIAQAVLAVTPQIHYDVLQRKRAGHMPGAVIQRVRGLLPYLSAGVAYAMLLLTVLPNVVDRLGLLIMGLILIVTALVIARHTLTLRENEDLALKRAEERFEALVQHSSDMVTLLDRDLICRYQSPSISDVVGRHPDEVVGTPVIAWVVEDDRQRVWQSLNRIMTQTDQTDAINWRTERPDGTRIVLESVVSNQLANSNVRGLVLNSRDITDRKELEEHLAYHAFHDPVTSLPNRSLFLEQLSWEVERASRQRMAGVLFIDVDNFKALNDTLGHEAGDEFLIAMSERIRESLRPNDLLARLAGDEFTILLKDLTSIDDAEAVAKRVIDSFKYPISYTGQTSHANISVGIAVSTGPEIPGTLVLRRADLAMFAAKRQGRNRIVQFEPWMEDELEERSAEWFINAPEPANRR